MLERYEESATPIVVHGRTCTAVARVRRLRLRLGPIGVGQAAARPHHLEIIHPDGRREVVAIHDQQRAAMLVVQAAISSLALLAWIVRRHR